MLTATATRPVTMPLEKKLSPCVTVVFPFEPKMDDDVVLERTKKAVLQKTSKKLKALPSETGLLLKTKLAGILSSLSHEVYTKSVAAHVGPEGEKVVYLNYAAEEYIACGEPFSLHGIAASKKSIPQYAVIILTGHHAKIYTGDNILLRRTATLSADYVPVSGTGEEKANLHTAHKLSRHDEIIKAFLQYTDNTLELLIEPQPYPIFVFGAEHYVEYFKKITKHQHLVAEYFSGDYKDLTEAGILNALQPCFANWHNVKEQTLLQHFERNFCEEHAYAGIKHVYYKSLDRRPWLLIAEKSFTAHMLNLPGELKAGQSDVDAIIENVLKHGGEVEFVADGALNCWGHIGLVHK